MNSILNDVLRTILAFFFDLTGRFLIMKSSFERKSIQKKWIKINKALLNDSIQPVGYDGQKDRLLKMTSGKEVFLAQTSGTRSLPKIIPYTKAKLKRTQFLFLKSMMILTHPFKGKKTFFVISSLTEEASLTAGMVKQKSPSKIELLQAPYRYLTTKSGEKLRSEIGADAARLALIIITAPRFLYATNPSTLTHLFDLIQHDWDPIKSNLIKLLKRKDLLSPLLKLQEGEGHKRLLEITEAPSAPHVSLIFPKLKGVITWDGGYVTPFTKKLMQLLPNEVQHIPMYSMSTETIETLPHLIQGKIYFLPTMPETYPEFLQDGKLFHASELKIGETYSLVITNLDGLIRYDTQDEFIVIDFVDKLPDLRFKRRRNITASMTGEKISEEQCHLLFEELKNHFPLQDHFLTLFGSAKNQQFRYHLGVIGPKSDLDLKALSKEAEKILGKLNEEYRSKVISGRLLSLKGEHFTLLEFAKMMGQEERLESQFKVMPLYERPLE